MLDLKAKIAFVKLFIAWLFTYVFHLRIPWHFSCAPPCRKRMPGTRCRRPIWKSDKRAYKWEIEATLSPGTPSTIRRYSMSFLWEMFAANNGTRPSLVSLKARRFPPYESPQSVIHPIAVRPFQKHLSSIDGLFSYLLYPSY